jgi:hypothetical protein
MRQTLLLLIVPIVGIYGQDLHHQMLSAQGNSTVLPNGMYVSQSIGQQSVSGNFDSNNYSVGQGFQQSLWSKYIASNETVKIKTVTYPNPFTESVNFQFSIPVTDVITVSLFDMRGRLIFQQEKKATDHILTIELPHLASAEYLVRLTATNFSYYSKIIKQK